MRAIAVHILAVLLIAIFAVGSPSPAKASCCLDCSTEAPAKNDGPCPAKGLVCQVAQSCASQVQKAPGQISIDGLSDAGETTFGFDASIAIKSAYRTPETAPPRT